MQKLSKTSLAFLGANFYEEKTLKPRVEEGGGVRDLAGVEKEIKKPIIRVAYARARRGVQHHQRNGASQ